MTIRFTDGAAFQRENTPGGGVFTTIAQAMNIKPPAKTRKESTVYTHDSPDPETVYGGNEPMKYELELAFDDTAAGHKQLHTDYDAKSDINYRVLWPSGRQEDFSAKIGSIQDGELNAEGTEPQTATVVFGLTSERAITWPA